MQYTLKLYRNTSENRDLIKNLENEHILIGETRKALDILTPEMLVSGIEPNEYNYCFIVELQRYYYIEGYQTDKGLSLLKMRVDVLMSYADDIKASSGLITKQRDYNPYYGEYDVQDKPELTRLEFQDKFNHNGEFVLVALRG